MVTIGIVGCGHWGKNLIRVFDQLETVHTCCHTGNQENEQWLQDNYPDISVTTAYEEMLGDDAIDAVAIATPIDTHYNLALKAVEAGKHVFVEKPLTPRTETAEALVSAAADRGLTLFVGYIFVHHSVFERIESIHSRTPIEYLKFDWERTGGFTENIVENLGSHDLAMAYQLFGSPPDSVTVVDDLNICGGENIVSFTASFPNDHRCRVDLDRLSNTKRKLTTITTQAGEVYVWSGSSLQKLNRKTEQFETVFESTQEPLERECQAFVDSIATGTAPRTDGEFGVAVTRMIERINDR